MMESIECNTKLQRLRQEHEQFADEVIKSLKLHFKDGKKYQQNFVFSSENITRAVITISFLFRHKYRQIYNVICGNLMDVEKYKKCCSFIPVKKDELYTYHFLKRISLIFELTMYLFKDGYDYFQLAEKCLAEYEDILYFEAAGGWSRLDNIASIFANNNRAMTAVINMDNPLEGGPQTFELLLMKVEISAIVRSDDEFLNSKEMRSLRALRDDFMSRPRISFSCNHQAYIKNLEASGFDKQFFPIESESSMHDLIYDVELEKMAIIAYFKSCLPPKVIEKHEKISPDSPDEDESVCLDVPEYFISPDDTSPDESEEDSSKLYSTKDSLPECNNMNFLQNEIEDRARQVMETSQQMLPVNDYSEHSLNIPAGDNENEADLDFLSSSIEFQSPLNSSRFSGTSSDESNYTITSRSSHVGVKDSGLLCSHLCSSVLEPYHWTEHETDSSQGMARTSTENSQDETSPSGGRHTSADTSYDESSPKSKRICKNIENSQDEPSPKCRRMNKNINISQEESSHKFRRIYKIMESSHVEARPSYRKIYRSIENSDKPASLDLRINQSTESSDDEQSQAPQSESEFLLTQNEKRKLLRIVHMIPVMSRDEKAEVHETIRMISAFSEVEKYFLIELINCVPESTEEEKSRLIDFLTNISSLKFGEKGHWHEIISSNPQFSEEDRLELLSVLNAVPEYADNLNDGTIAVGESSEDEACSLPNIKSMSSDLSDDDEIFHCPKKAADTSQDEMLQVPERTCKSSESSVAEELSKIICDISEVFKMSVAKIQDSDKSEVNMDKLLEYPKHVGMHAEYYSKSNKKCIGKKKLASSPGTLARKSHKRSSSKFLESFVDQKHTVIAGSEKYIPSSAGNGHIEELVLSESDSEFSQRADSETSITPASTTLGKEYNHKSECVQTVPDKPANPQLQIPEAFFEVANSVQESPEEEKSRLIDILMNIAFLTNDEKCGWHQMIITRPYFSEKDKSELLCILRAVPVTEGCKESRIIQVISRMTEMAGLSEEFKSALIQGITAVGKSSTDESCSLPDIKSRNARPGKVEETEYIEVHQDESLPPSEKLCKASGPFITNRTSKVTFDLPEEFKKVSRKKVEDSNKEMMNTKKLLAHPRDHGMQIGYLNIVNTNELLDHPRDHGMQIGYLNILSEKKAVEKTLPSSTGAVPKKSRKRPKSAKNQGHNITLCSEKYLPSHEEEGEKEDLPVSENDYKCSERKVAPGTSRTSETSTTSGKKYNHKSKCVRSGPYSSANPKLLIPESFLIELTNESPEEEKFRLIDFLSTVSFLTPQEKSPWHQMISTNPQFSKEDKSELLRILSDVPESQGCRKSRLIQVINRMTEMSGCSEEFRSELIQGITAIRESSEDEDSSLPNTESMKTKPWKNETPKFSERTEDTSQCNPINLPERFFKTSGSSIAEELSKVICDLSEEFKKVTLGKIHDSSKSEMDIVKLLEHPRHRGKQRECSKSTEKHSGKKKLASSTGMIAKKPNQKLSSKLESVANQEYCATVDSGKSLSSCVENDHKKALPLSEHDDKCSKRGKIPFTSETSVASTTSTLDAKYNSKSDHSQNVPNPTTNTKVCHPKKTKKSRKRSKK